MRISDWSSVVCSSDLDPGNLQNLIEQVAVLRRDADPRLDFRFPPQCMNHREKLDRLGSGPKNHDDFLIAQNFSQPQIVHSSDERRVGKECVMKCRFWW